VRLHHADVTGLDARALQRQTVEIDLCGLLPDGRLLPGGPPLRRRRTHGPITRLTSGRI
jgi:hypothetical protein